MQKAKLKILTGLMASMLVFSGCGDTSVQTPQTSAQEEKAQADPEKNTIDILDLVTLGEYMNISTGIKPVEVTDADIQKEITDFVDYYGGPFLPKDDAVVEDGYKVDISILNGDSDEAIANTSFVVGNDENFEDLHENIIGKKAGDKVSADGGEAKSYYRIDKVSVPSEINDEIVKNIGFTDQKGKEIKNLSDLKESVRDYLKDRNDHQYNADQKQACERLIVENSTFEEIPDILTNAFKKYVEQEINDAVASSEEDITAADIIREQMDTEGFIGTADDYVDWIAEKDAREYITCYAIAAKEDIKIEHSDVYSLAATDWAADMEKYPTLKDFITEKGIFIYEARVLVSAVTDFVASNSAEGVLVVHGDTEDIEGSSENSKTEAPKSPADNDAAEASADSASVNQEQPAAPSGEDTRTETNDSDKGE